jgi:hypothetical protein
MGLRCEYKPLGIFFFCNSKKFRPQEHGCGLSRGPGIGAVIPEGLLAASWPATAQPFSLGEAEEETIFDRMALTNTVASFTPRNLALSPWTDRH